MATEIWKQLTSAEEEAEAMIKGPNGKPQNCWPKPAGI